MCISVPGRSSYHYLTNISRKKYIVPSFKLTKSNYRIKTCAPKLWNHIWNEKEKLIKKKNPVIFKATTKTKLVLLENAQPRNAIIYFCRIYKTLNPWTLQEFCE